MTPARVQPMARGIGERELLGVAGGILLNGDQAGYAAAFGEDLAHAMAGRFGGDQRDINVGGRLDRAEVDVEAVREHQRLARGEVRRDVLGVDVGLRLIGDQDHDDVGPLGGVGDGEHVEAGLLRLGDANLLVAGRPTRTSTPESFRLSAWAWPCEP